MVVVYEVEIRIDGEFDENDDPSDKKTRTKLEKTLKGVDYKILEAWSK